MAKINVLDSSIYNLIAAGEVVERPASVVKELVENSIDAGAKNIRIDILDGGIRQIKVTDDGSGIEKQYLKNAFLPHATSKIAKADDLDSIMTLGFRGEALASIAAVSKVRLTTKTTDSDAASEISLSAGKIEYIQDVSANNGTTIVISDLFFNVPARAKFLKKPKSEEQEITNLIERFVLANPSLNISYFADGKQIIASVGNTLKDAMYAVYGKSAVSETLEIYGEDDGVIVTGYVGRPSYSKPNRTYQTVVINGRYVVNSTIATAVTNAYGEMLMKRKYPFFVIHLSIDPTRVDVNVHPNKLDVRFENSSKIFSLVFGAVSRTLSKMDYVLEVDTSTGEVIKAENIMPKIDNVLASYSAENATTKQISEYNNSLALEADKTENFGENTTNEPNFTNCSAKNAQNELLFGHGYQSLPSKSAKIDHAGVNLNPFSDLSHISSDQKEQKTQQIIDSAMKVASTDEMVADNFGLGSKLLDQLANVRSEQKKMEGEDLDSASVKLIGKLFNTYILVEYASSLYLIDQHAAHERILYEKFKRECDNNTIAVQPLMFPYLLTLKPAEYTIIEQYLPQIRELGFDADEFGDNTIKISSVPLMLADIDFESFFSGFLDEARANTITKQSDVIKEKLMQHSCKSAIKGGNDISKNEVESLFRCMNEEKIPLFCPHGRPIAVRVAKTEIEKWFKRIV